MVRQSHAPKILRVAGEAIGRSPGELEGRMTLFTLRRSVLAGEGERGRGVAEGQRRLHFSPRGREVARGAFHLQSAVRRALSSQRDGRRQENEGSPPQCAISFRAVHPMSDNRCTPFRAVCNKLRSGRVSSLVDGIFHTIRSSAFR